MPLPLPNLDDRRWGDLVDEGRALIPRYARGWTDHNVSDPGITLVELHASRSESSVYALNRVTARHRRKFLSLIGFAPEPPRPARTMVCFSPAGGSASFDLPAGVELEAVRPGGALLPFRTLRALTVSDVQLAAVQVDEGDGKGLADRTVDWRNGLPVRVFGREPRTGAALYLGFKAIPVGRPVTVALRWDRPGGDAPGRAVRSSEERARLVAEQAAWRRACRRPLPAIECPGSAPVVDPPPTTPPHHSARVVWEAYTGVWTGLEPVSPGSSLSPGQAADDTRSLTLDGLVELHLPPGVVKEKQGAVGTKLVYLRCRLASGAYDAPPTLLDLAPNAVPAEHSLPLSQRLTIPAAVTPSGPAPAPGTLTRLQLQTDAAGALQKLAFVPGAPGLPDTMVLDYQKSPSAEGHLTVEMVLAGRGNHLPKQQFMLPARAIVSDESLAVVSHDGGGAQPWDIRPDFDASGRVDWHCTLDPVTGRLEFGDGERGRVLPEGHLVLVTGRSTEGGAGSLRAPAPMAARRSPKNAVLLKALSAAQVAQLSKIASAVWPASGGADEETLAHAAGRAAEALHAHERLVALAASARSRTLDQVDRDRVRALVAPSNAISLLDIERIALDVPGTRVARARAWAGVLARHPCLDAPGFVTLVILPDMPTAQPQPSPGLLRAVKRYIDRRRMVTAIVQVVGPRYLAVDVEARVRLRRGADAAAVGKRIEAALDRFLDPRSGGPEGLGWPFGRPVYRAEILQLLDGVTGVDHVLDLSLSSPGGSPQCGNLTMCPTGLAASGSHRVALE